MNFKIWRKLLLHNVTLYISGIGSTCKTNEDCTAIVPNTECNSDTKLCTCKVGYAEANATCQKGNEMIVFFSLKKATATFYEITCTYVRI